MSDKLSLTESNDFSHSKTVNNEKRKLWDCHSSLQNESNISDKISFSHQISEKSKQLLADITRVSKRPYNILITGETGTGKTFAARQIHQNSIRSNKPFMELNCANLSEHLVEAELFGYRKGAFTGADRDHKGLFEEADGGILFLDEIGDVPPIVQNKLLKAIDEKKIKRLGTNHYFHCDVQIISATSRNLTEMVRRGEFREDLYCRVAVLTIEVPPLRERREDIPRLIDYYLRETASAVGTASNRQTVFTIEQGALELLCEYDYPGNIRVLKNLIYELTSYVTENQPITIEMVESILTKTRFIKRAEPSEESNPVTESVSDLSKHRSDDLSFLFNSIAKEGDIILPLEICVIRKDETYHQWARRVNICSIETARKLSGNSLRNAASRLGVSFETLKGRLYRAKANQPEDDA